MDLVRQVLAVNPIVGQLAGLRAQAVVSLLIGLLLSRLATVIVVGAAVFPGLGTTPMSDQQRLGTGTQTVTQQTPVFQPFQTQRAWASTT